jgi:kynureninase
LIGIDTPSVDPATSQDLAQPPPVAGEDPLRALREQFILPEGVIYLDGNSLGVLPKNRRRRVAEAVTAEWGQGLIRSWNSAGWLSLPQRLGNKIARLVGANPGEVVATDSTSINLYKVLSAALHIAAEDAPARRLIVSERSNFPTDLYIAEALCRSAATGCSWSSPTRSPPRSPPMWPC